MGDRKGRLVRGLCWVPKELECRSDDAGDDAPLLPEVDRSFRLGKRERRTELVAVLAVEDGRVLGTERVLVFAPGNGLGAPPGAWWGRLGGGELVDAVAACAWALWNTPSINSLKTFSRLLRRACWGVGMTRLGASKLGA